MGRLHSNGKGISASTLPYSRTPPAWLKTTPDQIVDQICKLAKKGATPSQIGVVLRDSHGVAQVKIVTGMYLLSVDILCDVYQEKSAVATGMIVQFHLHWLTLSFAGNKILRILKSNGTSLFPLPLIINVAG